MVSFEQQLAAAMMVLSQLSPRSSHPEEGGDINLFFFLLLENDYETQIDSGWDDGFCAKKTSSSVGGGGEQRSSNFRRAFVIFTLAERARERERKRERERARKREGEYRRRQQC
jgi:hypothetical protein